MSFVLISVILYGVAGAIRARETLPDEGRALTALLLEVLGAVGLSVAGWLGGELVSGTE
jgi:hypothetical protein